MPPWPNSCSCSAKNSCNCPLHVVFEIVTFERCRENFVNKQWFFSAPIAMGLFRWDKNWQSACSSYYVFLSGKGKHQNSIFHELEQYRKLSTPRRSHFVNRYIEVPSPPPTLLLLQNSIGLLYKSTIRPALRAHTREQRYEVTVFG